MNLFKKWWGGVSGKGEPKTVSHVPSVELTWDDIKRLRSLVAYMRRRMVFLQEDVISQCERDYVCKCALKGVEFIYYDSVDKLEELVNRIESGSPSKD